MRIGISTGILLVVVALTCGCNQSDLEYNENDYGYDIEMATPTAFTENKTMVLECPHSLVQKQC